MPNTILKRWNGTAFEELYPKTTVGQISASGTANSTTFLRGDGQWQIPATQSHTHGNILNNGTMTAAAVAIETGDRILITNNNNSQLIERGVDFDTSVTSTFLRRDGQWQIPTISTANITDITKVNVTTGTVTSFSVNNRATLATATGEYHFYGTIWAEKISTSTTSLLTIGIRSSSSVTSQLVAEFIASTNQTSDGATSYLIGDTPNIDTTLTVTGNRNAFNLATSGSATTGHYAISFSGFFRLSSNATISLAVNANASSAYSISGGFVVITAK